MSELHDNFFFKDKSLAALAQGYDALAVFMGNGDNADSDILLGTKLNSHVEFLIFKERERQLVINDHAGNKGLYLTFEVQFQESLFFR